MGSVDNREAPVVEQRPHQRRPVGDDGPVGERGLRTFPGRCVEDCASGASRCTGRRPLADLELRTTDQHAMRRCVPEHRVGLDAVDRRLAGHEEEVVGLALVGDGDALVAVAVGEVHVCQRREAQRREVLRVVVDVQRELDVAARQQVVERAVARDGDRRQSRLLSAPAEPCASPAAPRSPGAARPGRATGRTTAAAGRRPPACRGSRPSRSASASCPPAGRRRRCGPRCRWAAGRAVAPRGCRTERVDATTPLSPRTEVHLPVPPKAGTSLLVNMFSAEPIAMCMSRY